MIEVPPSEGNSLRSSERVGPAGVVGAPLPITPNKPPPAAPPPPPPGTLLPDEVLDERNNNELPLLLFIIDTAAAFGDEETILGAIGGEEKSIILATLHPKVMHKPQRATKSSDRTMKHAEMAPN